MAKTQCDQHDTDTAAEYYEAVHIMCLNNYHEMVSPMWHLGMSLGLIDWTDVQHNERETSWLGFEVSQHSSVFNAIVEHYEYLRNRE